MPSTSDSKSAVARRKPRRAPRRLRRRFAKPRLTIAAILEWADRFHQERGRWPHHFDGHIRWAGEDTWARANDALARGNRGLPGGSSLAKLLFIYRGVRSPRNVPRLSEERIFAWARLHFNRTGKWPKGHSGPIQDAPAETWSAVDLALSRGTRGLPGGSSLAALLDKRGVKRNAANRPPFSISQILALADAFHRSRGHWPYRDSGTVDGLPGETWLTIDRALQRGLRGLAPGRTLASLLNKHRGIFGGRKRRPPRVRKDRKLRLTQILTWGKAYRRQMGIFPNRSSGPIAGTDGLKWSTVDSALKRGSRGLPDGSSLATIFGDR